MTNQRVNKKSNIKGQNDNAKVKNRGTPSCLFASKEQEPFCILTCHFDF